MIELSHDDDDMTFLDHLEELRWRLIKSVISIFIGSGITFLFIDEIIELNEDQYVEKQLEFFKPDWKNNLIGLHTFNYEKGCTVIDTRVKRNKFSKL